MITAKSRVKRYRRPDAARYLRDNYDIPFTTKTLANRNAAGLDPKPEYLGTTPFYREDVLDRFGETAFQSESPVAVTRRRHKEIFAGLRANRDDPDAALPPAGTNQG